MANGKFSCVSLCVQCDAPHFRSGLRCSRCSALNAARVHAEKFRGRPFSGIHWSNLKPARSGEDTGPVCLVTGGSCAHCGTPFFGRLLRKYCLDCALPGSQRQCLACGVKYGTARRTKKYIRGCSPACIDLLSEQATAKQRSASKESKRNRKRMKRANVRQAVSRLRVFSECAWRCQSCGCESPRSLLGSQHPDAPELDHIVPVSKGGAHARSNLQLLCRTCNCLKGAKAPDEWDRWRGVAA